MVEAAQAEVEQSEAAVAQDADALKQSCESTVAQMGQYGIQVNPYTTLTVSDLQASRASLDAAVADRRSAYNAVLQVLTNCKH